MDMMRIFSSSRLRSLAQIWVVPGAYIVAALALGNLLPRFDHLSQIGLNLFNPQTAGGLLSTISAGMISFTGFVFSMVFVLVQFGSTTYTPRLAGYLLQDPVVRHALGIFTGTFLYTLTAYLYLGADGADNAPTLTILAALTLVVLSVCIFLALIHRITSLRVTSVLQMVGARARQVIEKEYPDHFTPEEQEDMGDHQSMLEQIPHPLPPVTQSLIYRGAPRVMVELNRAYLVRLARQAGGLIEVRYAIGDTLPDGAVMLVVRGAERPIRPASLHSAVEIGAERTIEQDPKYAFRLIADIAIRALSPAVNDPSTAVQALDELDDMLRRIGTRHLDVGLGWDAQGVLRLIYPTPDWEDFLSLAVDEIRLYGASSIQVMRRLFALLQDVQSVLPAERARAVVKYLARVRESILHTFPDEADQLAAQQADRQGIGLTRPVPGLDELP